MKESDVLHGSCLCGDVTYQSSQSHKEMWNCHCQTCRKTSSVAFATWIKTEVASFKWLDQKSSVISYYSSPAMLRSFCSKCGTVLPAFHEKDNCVFLPASGISTEHDLSPTADLFVEEIPSWYDLNDAGAEVSVESKNTDWQAMDLHRKNEGSCLCGKIKYSITGEVDAIRGCHCSRCRQRSGTAFFAGLPVLFTDFQISGDENNTNEYFLPDSQYYRYSFCNSCGTVIPGIFPDGKRTVIGAGTLDSTSPVRLMYHIYYESKAPWINLNSSKKCFDGPPPIDYDWKSKP